MKPINILILFSFLLFSVNSNADFTGTYEFSKWDKTIVGGSITSASNDSVTLISSNDDNEDAPQLYTNQDLTISILTDGNVSFHWQYNSDDESSFWDPFGYLLNGTFTELTQNKIENSTEQQGDFTIAVYAGSIFGFRVNSYDSNYGAATVVISNFSAPAVPQVPLPAALWLFCFGLFGILWQAKRRQIKIRF